MFDQCPKEYHLYYLDPHYKKEKYNLMKQPENIRPALVLGGAIHNAITLFYHLPHEKQTLEELLLSLRETWRNFDVAPKMEELPLGKVGGFKTIEEERQAYREAQEMLENFFEMRSPDWDIFYRPTKDFVNSIEDYKGLITPLNEGADISGKFDLIIEEKDGLRIIDFKTGRNDREDVFQLHFYKILAEKNFQIPVAKGSFFFLKSKTEKEHNLEGQDAKELENEILERIENIKQTVTFEAQPSTLCQFCLFRNFCSEGGLKTTGSREEIEAPSDLPF